MNLKWLIRTIYSGLFGYLLFPVIFWVAQWLGSKENFSERKRSLKALCTSFQQPLELPDKLAWFHAASVGELESLWGLVLRKSVTTPVVLTVFSFSALTAIKKLEQEVLAAGGTCIYAGISPWEGRWGDVLRTFVNQGRSALGPSRRKLTFVTVRYEAWPELWWSLRNLGDFCTVKLFVLCASVRKSLTLALWLQKVIGSGPPLSLCLVAQSDEGQKSLLAKYVKYSSRITVLQAQDPRWDRVANRVLGANGPSSEVVSLLEGVKERPRPWLVVGSAWLADLEFIVPRLKTDAFFGTVFVFPHALDAGNLIKMTNFLHEMDESFYVCSSGLPVSASRWIIVDRMGVLVEFYKFADKAWVGGGLSTGIHSTLEPAVALLPIAAGTNGVTRFPEIAEVTRIGQFTPMNFTSDFAAWLAGVSDPTWKTWVSSKMGGTEKVLKWLDA